MTSFFLPTSVNSFESQNKLTNYVTKTSQTFNGPLLGLSSISCWLPIADSFTVGSSHQSMKSLFRKLEKSDAEIEITSTHTQKASNEENEWRLNRWLKWMCHKIQELRATSMDCDCEWRKLSFLILYMRGIELRLVDDMRYLSSSFTLVLRSPIISYDFNKKSSIKNEWIKSRGRGWTDWTNFT